MKSIVLPAGTEHVLFGELAYLIADALWPDAGPNDEHFRHGAACGNLDGELARAVKSGALPVKDPLTLGPHTFPIGAALKRALVTVDDLREFVAGRSLSVLFQFTINEDGGSTTFSATQEEYDAMAAGKQAQRDERHKRGHYSMYEAAEVLAAANSIGGAEAFFKNRMRPAAESGALVLLDPIDGGPVTGRLCRPYDDWVTPKAINEWLAGAGFAYRWPVTPTATQAPPVVAVGALDDTPPTNWRHLIQAEAYEHWLRLRASGCNPSVYSICGDMAKWCADNEIKGDKGQDPKAGTIRNTVLDYTKYSVGLYEIQCCTPRLINHVVLNRLH